MKKNNNLIEETKQELIDNIIKSKPMKVAKYATLGLVSIYALGHVFKILAFTNSSYRTLKNSFKNPKIGSTYF